MSKRKFHSVKLRFFQDDNTGDWGLAHENTCFDSQSPFNAFFNGIGIFHDVFEHWFEGKHKYFRGEAFLNRGGECAAMGAAWYFYNVLGMSNRHLNNRYNFGDLIRTENQDAIQETIEVGYCYFGNTFICDVPVQSPVYDTELEHQLSIFWDEIKNVIPKGDHPEEKEFGRNYKKSISKSKISNLYRWGFRTAERMIPDNRANTIMVYEFVEFFNEWCKNNSAEELASMFNYLQIDLYKENGEVTWKATLLSNDYNIPDVRVRNNKSIDIYDLIPSDY